MNIKELRNLYRIGAVAGFRAKPAPDNAGWMLEVQMQDNSRDFFETTKGKRRVYSRVGSLLDDVREISSLEIIELIIKI